MPERRGVGYGRRYVDRAGSVDTGNIHEEIHSWTGFCFLLLFFNVCLFFRERQSESRGGAEREGDKEAEAGSRL